MPHSNKKTDCSYQTTIFQRSEYRKDIDGLRAFAVGSVVIYHAFPDLMRGGFVGVDIFFVISGFLITSILAAELEKGTLDFLNFYVRRIRRLFPALSCVLAFCALTGWLALFPEEFERLGRHILGGSIYVSNFILLNESGYFDTNSLTKPLLHLWSLSIEEQFYFLWPLFLWLAGKWRVHPLLATTAAGLLSFGVCLLYTSSGDRVPAFYLPWCRFWELAAGGSLAWIMRHPDAFASFAASRPRLHRLLAMTRAERLQDLLCGLGFLLLLYSFWKMNADWPGKRTLIPVLGTALIILSGARSRIGKAVFANPVAVFVGLVSYPFYLWHWVLLSLAFIVHNGDLQWPVRVGCVFSSFILATATYYWVERPLRFGAHGRAKAGALLAALLALGGMGLLVNRHDGFPSRFADTEFHFIADELALSKAMQPVMDRAYRNGDALFPEWKTFAEGWAPWLYRKAGENTIAIAGDSHAIGVFCGLLHKNDDDEGLEVFASPGSAPLIDVSTHTRRAPSFTHSGELFGKAYHHIVNDARVKVVILAHNPHYSMDDAIDLRDRSLSDTSVIMERGLRRTLDALTRANKTVFILLDNPHLPSMPNAFLRRPLQVVQAMNPRDFSEQDDPDYRARMWYAELVRKVTADYPGVSVIDLVPLFVEDGRFMEKAHTFYMDQDHLNYRGSVRVADFLWPILKEALAAPRGGQTKHGSEPPFFAIAASREASALPE